MTSATTPKLRMPVARDGKAPEHGSLQHFPGPHLRSAESCLGAALPELCQEALIPSFVICPIFSASWAARNTLQGGDNAKKTFMKELTSAVKVTSKSHTTK